MKTSGRRGRGALVSYATLTNANEFLMFPATDLRIFVKGTQLDAGLKVDDGQWHHVCVTWSSNGGNWVYYDNGAEYTSGSGLESGKCITGGGTLLLGQEQDEVGGGFHPLQCLIGRITGFNLWSKALSGDEVAAVFNDCAIGGDIFAWNVADLEIRGDVNEIEGDFCDEPAIPQESDEAGQTLELTSSDTYVGVLRQMPQLSALTSCIWVKTSGPGTKATLVSYAASTHHNEFLMYPAGGLKIFVKGCQVTAGLKVDDDQWHHVCVTWSSNGGNWIYYDNGAKYTYGSGLASGKSITGGGTLILGQEQDEVGGGLDPSQALIGSITGFNFWSNALSGDEVAAVFNDCSIGGDIFAWNVEDLEITGDVTEINVDFCACVLPDLTIA
ncbi:C-reactive protein 1.4-like [Ptychodera flava]|uniref:C-reactive protein 1.4-like n=1 Tax=Ptychodera flava TaxID=63121 RepID=UPI00396AA4A2